MDAAFGSVAYRNHPIRLSEVSAHIKRVNAIECYTTYFRYDRTLPEYVRRTKTVKGFGGVGYADYFPIDIDSPNLGVSLDRAKQAVEYLLSKEIPEGDIKIYFSGCKGFHILLDATLFDLEPIAGLEQVYKAMARHLSKELGLDLDPTIYDAMRLFRLENTLNNKANLYKIPLVVDELFEMSVDEIKALAAQPRIISEPVRNGIPNDWLTRIFLASLEATEEKKRVTLPNRQAVQVGRDVKPCIARLLAGAVEGERDNTALRLAVHYKKEGMPASAVMGLLSGWNENNAPPLEDEAMARIVNSAFQNGYDFGCNDFLLQANCSEDCPMKRKKTERTVLSKDIMPLSSLVESYAEGLLRKTGRVFLGIPEIDKATRGMVGGEVVCLMARPGVGKTALMLNTLLNQPPDVPSMFFSLEMPATQIFERAASMVTGMSAREVEELIKDPEQKAEVAKAVADKFRNVFIVDKDALGLKEIEDYITAAEKEVLHQKVRLVLIDHMGRMTAKGRSEYEVISANARAMKQLAKDRDVVVYTAVQVGRDEGGGGKEELSLSAARGSGQIEEGADLLLGMWRPDFDDDTRDYDVAHIAAVKNRKGARVKTSMTFHRNTLLFDPIVKKSGKRAIDI